MVLKEMVDIDTIRSLKGVVDIYYWKGLAVARKWPRHPRQPNTPAQVATRNAFKAMHAWRKRLPSSIVAQWRQMNTPPEKSREDVVRQQALKAAFADVLFDPPEPLASHRGPGPDGANEYVTIDYAPPAGFLPAAWTIRYKPVPAQGEPLSWQQIGVKVWRNNNARPIHAPAIAAYQLPLDSIFDLTAEQYRARIAPTTYPIQWFFTPVEPPEKPFLLTPLYLTEPAP